MKRALIGFSLLALAACARAGSTDPALPAPESRTVASDQASSGTYATVFDFNGTDGAHPASALTVSGGILYGTTPSGGAQNDGTAFSLTPSGTQTVIHNFGDTKDDGIAPVAPLTLYKGTLYGTTRNGGKPPKGGGCTGGCGTMFAIDAGGKERKIQDFDFFTDGDTIYPTTAFVPIAGTLYGTSGYSVYSASTSGVIHTLHKFTGYPNDGEDSNQMIAVGGALYGATFRGGAHKFGAVYTITTAGSESLLYSFQDVPDARYPQAGLVNLGGTLYGTTDSGGTGKCKHVHEGKTLIRGCGTVFKILPSGSGTESVLYSFLGDVDGAYPQAGLTAVKGTLYGTTSAGGGSGGGTLFRITTDGKKTILHGFGHGTDGSDPVGGLVYFDGMLYGTTASGGTYGEGTVFAIKP